MGLLDRIKNIGSNPLAMAGLGLLSAPTHSRYPINPLQYGLQGMQAGYQNQQAQAESLARQQENAQRQQMYQLQVAEHQQKMEEATRARTLQQQQEAAQSAWLTSQPPEVAALARAYPDLFAEQMKQKMKPQGYESGPGKRAQDLMKINPALAPATAYAQAQQEIMREKTAGASRIQIGGEDKAVLSNAVDYVMPDGKPPPPTATPSEIVAGGGRIRTSEEKTGKDASAKLAAKQENASHAVGGAIDGYYGAVERWRAKKDDVNAFAEAEQQRRRMGQVLASARNPGRAPTDADVEMAMKDIPNPLSISQGAGAAMGGDPFLARMKVIEQELGYKNSRASDGWTILPNGVKIREKQ